MGEYIVSARKYRPATFDTVVGQSSLTTTLKNAVKSGKLAHAYLFCGPRGVGKTTCARIFARTINCLSPLPDGEACGKCESCKSFNEQRSYNIFELDAASNNSVEDIRTLIEEVRIPPQIGRYKVYIIDEVHMLSTAAFNAFLKTLEEPPRHAVFILATTEKHKLLPTILSRCQIYDFQRITVSDIAAHLADVADSENVKYEPEALRVIARKADGGMRDALSIFDQVTSFTGGNITYKATIDNLNVLDSDIYFRLTDMFLNAQTAQTLLLFNEVLSNGFDGAHFINGLASHLRDLLVSHEETTLQLLEAGEEMKKRYREQSSRCSDKFLYKAMKLCNDCDINYKESRNRRLLVELTLIQCSQLSTPDDEPSSGRKPTIKPIFNKETKAADKPVETTAAAATQDKAPRQAVKQPAASQPEPAPVSEHHSPFENNKATTSHQPKIIKKGQLRTTSFRNFTNKHDEEPKAEETTPESDYDESYKIDSEKLDYLWRAYASILPVEHKANAMRMMAIRPKALKGNQFEVVVENEIVAGYMRHLSPYIEEHISSGMGVHVHMQVRIDKSVEKAQIYNPVERYKKMVEQNPALARLAEAIGLRPGI